MVRFEPVRNITNYEPIINDIESHLEAGHPYRDNDKVTWTHEGTHGINSLMRQKFGQPSFYVLNGDAFLLPELNTTLKEIAAALPSALRGNIYNLYLVKQQKYWNGQPSYLCDELSAYLNGSQARAELGIAGRTETVTQAYEMFVYCLFAVYMTKDQGWKDYLAYQAKRIYAWEAQLPGPALAAARQQTEFWEFATKYTGPAKVDYDLFG